MTTRDAEQLVRILGGAPVTGPSLATELLRHYRMHERVAVLLADAIRERNELKRELQATRAAKTRAQRGSKAERELRAELEAKTKTLRFAVHRNEVLKRQVNGG